MTNPSTTPLTAFPQPLMRGVLMQRYKRFFADIRLEDGQEIVAHCPNPGAMLGLKDPGLTAWVSTSHDPKRKLKQTLELVEIDGVGVGINTNWPNRLGEALMQHRLIPGLDQWTQLRREVAYDHNSRIDLLLSDGSGAQTYVEIKNVHLCRKPGLAEFPDCVTARGLKHLEALSRVVEAGHRAVMLYIVQRADCERFAIASDLDPAYARGFEAARNAGVEALAARIRCTPAGMFFDGLMPIVSA